jgi:small subunit ribosomal protein S6|tara:strand:+ start:771 stop:1109 length:339 start_codon:yes stop_codon:yes gene_type:complete
MNQYETVFILNPVLSETQIEEAVQKYIDLIKSQKGSISNQENWGLKKLAYPIENKKSGFYHLFEFAASSDAVPALEVEFRRDERVMRYLTVKLDKHGQAWAEKRKKRIKAKS